MVDRTVGGSTLSRKRKPPEPSPSAASSPLRAAIESHSRQLNLTRLIRERKKVRAISMEVLERILCQVIANVVVEGDLDPLLDKAALEARTKDELHRLMREAQEGRPPEEGNDRGALQDQIARLEEELDRHRAELAQDRALTPEEVQAREIDRLQRRITKLNRALEANEDALRRLALEKNVDDGVASIYGDFQGLSGDDAKYREKREMIHVVFVNNLKLKNREVTDTDLEGVRDDWLLDVPGSGGDATNRPASDAASDAPPIAETPKKPADRPSGPVFRKPVEPLIDETSF